MGQSLSLSLSVALDISLPFFSDTSGGMGATLPSPSLSFNPLVHRRKRERERESAMGRREERAPLPFLSAALL